MLKSEADSSSSPAPQSIQEMWKNRFRLEHSDNIYKAKFGNLTFNLESLEQLSNLYDALISLNAVSSKTENYFSRLCDASPFTINIEKIPNRYTNIDTERGAREGTWNLLETLEEQETPASQLGMLLYRAHQKDSDEELYITRTNTTANDLKYSDKSTEFCCEEYLNDVMKPQCNVNIPNDAKIRNGSCPKHISPAIFRALSTLQPKNVLNFINDSTYKIYANDEKRLDEENFRIEIGKDSKKTISWSSDTTESSFLKILHQHYNAFPSPSYEPDSERKTYNKPSVPQFRSTSAPPPDRWR
jgi:hypothetical protein